jgi:hypothetical protein
MRYVRLDERLQLDGDALFAMHSLAVTAIEEPACLARAASQREPISDRCVRDEDEINSLRASSSVDSTLADASRGYRSDRLQIAEIVVHSRAMQYAKYHDRKNSERDSLTERVSTILSMSPALKTYEGKCENNAELFLRTRIARVIECDACGATSGCS